MTESMIRPILENDVRYISRQLDELDASVGIAKTPDLSRRFLRSDTKNYILHGEAILSCEYGIGHISHLFVWEASRGQGHGRKLLEDVETYAKENGITKIFGATTTWQCSALYEHCGYSETSREPLDITIGGIQQYFVNYKKDIA